jgi:hypothetical protein
METKQLNDYKIEFYSKREWGSDMEINGVPLHMYLKNPMMTVTLYLGLVSSISEELAEKIVDKADIDMYMNYKESNEIKSWYNCHTAKQSFETLSDLPYCVITKL